ncbi:MAG: GNAT family N-acetyltransferase [Cetobacterium sp.]|uniref:GNAT family N-acetyltransferase n=1 Tax=Cetobacterium sp. TaxID=2071632 RepID=UPI003F3449DF
MLKGKKIKLRTYKITDVEKLYELFENENIKKTLLTGILFPMSKESEKDFIEGNLKPKGELFNFAVERLEDGECVGGCGINSIDRKNSVAVIGLWIGEKYHGNGYGSDLLRVLCKFIFEEMNIHKIKLECFSFNEKGLNCYKAVGFKEEGRLRQEIFREGKYYDTIAMGIFKDELK